MPTKLHLAALCLLIGAAACAERGSSPTAESSETPGDVKRAAPEPAASAAQAGLESLARTLALSLREPRVRADLKSRLDRSAVREHKLHFQRFLLAGAQPGVGRIAPASGVPEAALRTEAQRATPLELYPPVPAHRAAWTGDDRILVATALRDHDAPVAFDVEGRRRILSPDQPPAVPVLALVPVETDFGTSEAGDAGLTGVQTAATCSPTALTCGSSGSGSTPSAPGLWMTAAAFNGTFEGWLKGAPEFETHILGQAGTSDSLTDYQCAGEKQAAPYYYDQNSESWTGNVLLFSQSQIDAYKAAHPGNSMRIVVVEDDDTACQIKLDANRFRTALNAVDSAFQRLTAGRDSTSGLTRIWSRATAFQKIFKALWSVITTQDDYVGTAVQDAVAGEYRAGMNWIVKGENNITVGGLKLEMR